MIPIQLLAAGLGITPSPKNCIRAFKSAMSIMSGNGLYKLKNSEDDMDRVGRSRMITRFYFAVEIRGRKGIYQVTRIILPRGEKESCDDSSLVMHRLCDRARGQNTAVGCFYFKFPKQKEQPMTSKYAKLLLDIFLAEWKRFRGQEQKKGIGGCGPQLVVYEYCLDDDRKIGPPKCCYRKFCRRKHKFSNIWTHPTDL